jgi:hypothetical protein
MNQRNGLVGHSSPRPVGMLWKERGPPVKVSATRYTRRTGLLAYVSCLLDGRSWVDVLTLRMRSRVASRSRSPAGTTPGAGAPRSASRPHGDRCVEIGP